MGELREFCLIRCNFNRKKSIYNLIENFKRGMNFVTVKPCCILIEIIGLFAEGFPPFPGESGHWDCGITFFFFFFFFFFVAMSSFIDVVISVQIPCYNDVHNLQYSFKVLLIIRYS